ncbi:phage tail protein [Novosphingobium sp. SL115]|uniref:phage tail protein n=1 Tax=Novosphingobium sp. SL115 TaxID=2995150 RepID=UPI0022757D7F|nr:phage tail protein [Novosphingobium sp. SL115]MCY1672109.1 phage tail protein [Novosphingobium sp. SL115]
MADEDLTTRKIDSLRTALFSAIPELRNDKARVPVWIDRGTGQGTQTTSNSFGLAFRLNVLAMGVKTDLSFITNAVLKWLHTHQPDLLQPGKDSFTFDADLLDNGTADVLIQLDLTQNYVVSLDNQGREHVAPQEQDDPVLADQHGFAGVNPVPNIAAILLDGAPFLPPDA